MNQLKGHLREKGQAVAAEVLGDISQTNVHTDQPENNNNNNKQNFWKVITSTFKGAMRTLWESTRYKDGICCK